MSLFVTITILLSAYLAGSIPTSVWVGKIFYNIDIREFGSGNAGATNTFRVLGAKAGIPVFIFDIFKGWFAVNLIIYSNLTPLDTDFYTLEIFLGIFAIIGHIFPAFAQFRGGKGIATALGVVIALHPWSALILLAVFAVSLAITKYVSLSSIICAVLFPVLIIFFFRIPSDPMVIFSVLLAIAVIFTHKQNIVRLLKGEEKKFSFSSSSKKPEK